MTKKLFGFLWLLAMLPAAMLAQQTVQDASYRTGRLANGLTYYIRHNAKEAGIADFYIAQRVGSILEEPRQRGLAHFLEHMAFNGTRHFRGDSTSMGIVPWCETIGVKFGANLNAYTSVDQTVYNISAVPVKREAIIDSTLLILHDWSCDLLLDDKEIDKERGVIREEWRTRRAGRATERMAERVMPIIYRGSKYEDCLPIGSMDIVNNFAYQDLRDYYRKWYRPDLQAIIVVGDIDVDRVEQKIKQVFGPIPTPVNPAKRVYYPVPDNKDIIVATDRDSEQPIMLATLYMKRDATPDSAKQSWAYVRDGYVDDLVASMLSERLQALQHLASPPVLSASARIGNFFVSRTKEAFALSFGCRQENVRGSFDAVIAEAERARRYGFTADELSRAKAKQLKAAERRYAERNDRVNRQYVSRALRNFLTSEPMVDDDTQLAGARRLDAEVTLEEVNAAAKAAISDANQVLVVYAPDKPDFHLPTESELKQYVVEAQSRSYEPYKEQKVATRLMDKQPKAGKIVSEKQVAHGTVEMVLSNGIKVYVKPTDYSKDQVSMRLWADGGTLRFPESDVPNFPLVSGMVSKAGVASFDELTLRKMLASKIVQLRPMLADNEHGFNGSSSVKDLPTLFELLHLYVTSPRTDEVAFRGEIDRMRSFYTNREANPQVGYNDTLRSILYGDAPRMRPLKRETLDRVSYGRVMDIYRTLFSNMHGASMLLVGNVNIDSLRPLLCRYVASLPVQRDMGKAKDAEAPRVVDGNETHIFRKKMNTPSALVNIFYTFDEPFTPNSDLTLDVMKRVLQIAYTDSVREEKGGTYGVGVSAQLSKDEVPSALVKISFRTDPAKYEELIPIIYRQIQLLAEQGPRPESMDKVKKFLLKTYQQNVINNGYWDYVMYNLLRDGIDYDTNYEQLVEQLSAEDVRQAARRMLQSNRRIEVTMLPE